jgi:hypothetical protein
VQASEPSSVNAVAARDLTPRVLPGVEHPRGAARNAEPGDVILFPHGDAHLMSELIFNARDGNALEVTAQNAGESGSVTCEIIVDGTAISRARARLASRR